MSTQEMITTRGGADAQKDVVRRTEPALLVNLNTLRAIAAIAVVYSHITSEAGLHLRLSIGTRGVDIFFVISGFIIAYIGSRNSDRFFLRRLIRVVPFYWVATLALFSVVLVAPHLLRSTQPDIVQLLCSLFFIPRETAYAGMFPTLVLGWSLNYEMYFYVIFSLALLVSKRFAPILCCMAIITMLLAITASGAQNPSVQFYARPLVFEFVFGIGIFYLLYWVEQHRAALQEAAAGRICLLLVLLVSLVAIFYVESQQGFGLPRQISSGIPAFLIVLSALLLERIYRVTVNNRPLFLLGESSYILYLIHPYVVYGLLRTVLRGEHHSLPVTIAIIVILLAVSSAIAIAIHLWFEKPAMVFLRRRILGEGLPRADQMR
ncbi:acyltransferase [Rhodanobacter sp. L36]|uniref:acyltransferase family protein n=1 Tax=Rhodanobacter sp. L36 TaxID=1747221 RepID=UPI00131DF441|nr:acyltransferase [Rhodanobacter sp. L36]